MLGNSFPGSAPSGGSPSSDHQDGTGSVSALRRSSDEIQPLSVNVGPSLLLLPGVPIIFAIATSLFDFFVPRELLFII